LLQRYGYVQPYQAFVIEILTRKCRGFHVPRLPGCLPHVTGGEPTAPRQPSDKPKTSYSRSILQQKSAQRKLLKFYIRKVMCYF